MKISVLLSTYNRGHMLCQTLENFCGVDTNDIEVEFVVVDNNSTDSTAEVIDSFRDRLPLVHLFQSKPGKNAALNLALDTVELGDLVVFTDDDVKPDADWLKNIVCVSENHPDINVFGGKVYPLWPDNAPAWIYGLSREFIDWAYANHDYGKEMEYQENSTPVGPNYWVRKGVFSDGRRFNEAIGPIPDFRKRVMGSETSFLRELLKDGHNIWFSPKVVVGHMITSQQVTAEYLIRRSSTRGRSHVMLAGKFNKPGLYNKFPLLWLLLRLVMLLWYLCGYAVRSLMPISAHSIECRCKVYSAYSYTKYYLFNHKMIYKSFGKDE